MSRLLAIDGFQAGFLKYLYCHSEGLPWQTLSYRTHPDPFIVKPTVMIAFIRLVLYYVCFHSFLTLYYTYHFRE